MEGGGGGVSLVDSHGKLLGSWPGKYHFSWRVLDAQHSVYLLMAG